MNLKKNLLPFCKATIVPNCSLMLIFMPKNKFSFIIKENDLCTRPKLLQKITTTQNPDNIYNTVPETNLGEHEKEGKE